MARLLSVFTAQWLLPHQESGGIWGYKTRHARIMGTGWVGVTKPQPIPIPVCTRGLNPCPSLQVALTNHPSHLTFRTDTKIYGKAIIQAKRSHWENYLEEMTADEIWVTNKYLKNPSGDGGLTRIPSLKSTNATGITSIIDDNESKAVRATAELNLIRF